jgi:hypothetical protein
MYKPSKNFFYNFWKTTEKMFDNFLTLGTRIVSF